MKLTYPSKLRLIKSCSRLIELVRLMKNTLLHYQPVRLVKFELVLCKQLTPTVSDVLSISWLGWSGLCWLHKNYSPTLSSKHTCSLSTQVMFSSSLPQSIVILMDLSITLVMGPHTVPSRVLTAKALQLIIYPTLFFHQTVICINRQREWWDISVL